MGETIALTAADGFRFDACLARPQGAAHGALVIGPEIFGVNAHIRSVVDRFAADGYVTIAPRLFDRVQRDYETGYGADDIAAGRAIIAQLPWPQTMQDTAAAVAQVRGEGKVAVVGYCWGGTIAWLAASRLADVACAVAYYGGGLADFIGESPRIPVMLHIGEQDTRPSPEHGREVVRRHPGVQLHVYPGAGHGFSCDQRGSYDAPSAALARERTLVFLQQHL